MTRILHVTQGFRPTVGGIEVFVEGLARRQAAAGHDVTVYTTTPGPPEPGDGPAVVRSRRGRWPILLHAPEGAVLRRTDPELVHAHLSLVSPFPALVARAAVRAGIPVVLTVHSMWTGRLALVRLVGAIAGWRRWPAAWTAVSGPAAASVRRALPTGTHVEVVPNAVDVEFWRAGLGPAGLGAGDLEPAAPARTDVMVASVLRFVPRKRPVALVRMLEAARQRIGPDTGLRVVLVGEGPLLPRVRSLLRQHDMESWVRLTGPLGPEQIRDLYRTADLYVAPSRLESFGIAAFEARAAGLPVLALDSGGVGEFVEDGVSGLLVADDDALVVALTRLVEDPGLRRTIAAHNRSVAPRLDWAQALAHIEAVYASVRESSGGRPTSAAGDASRPLG